MKARAAPIPTGNTENRYSAPRRGVGRTRFKQSVAPVFDHRRLVGRIVQIVTSARRMLAVVLLLPRVIVLLFLLSIATNTPIGKRASDSHANNSRQTQDDDGGINYRREQPRPQRHDSHRARLTHRDLTGACDAVATGRDVGAAERPLRGTSSLAGAQASAARIIATASSGGHDLQACRAGVRGRRRIPGRAASGDGL